jgi:UDP-3-O-[3-hydroxymyristoyl] N-acetylglucosamine deacetylase
VPPADVFAEAIAPARTFGFYPQVEALRARGLALGGNLRNAVVLDGARVLNEEGLRFADELVRHKILDAIGDLALVGAPIQGRYIGYKPGHRLNQMLLSSLFADKEAWCYRPLYPQRGPLPGALAGAADQRRRL